MNYVNTPVNSAKYIKYYQYIFVPTPLQNRGTMQEISTLSRQEKKILTALSSGSLYKEIAADHHISINTVKKHLKNIYRKLHVNKRTQAIEKFLEEPNLAGANFQMGDAVLTA